VFNAATTPINNSSALGACVINQLPEVSRLIGFRQRSDADAGFPGDSALEPIYSITEGCNEGIDNVSVNKQHFESRAPLTVVGEPTQNSFLNCVIHVSVLQNDSCILGFESEYATQAMRFWMLLLQNVSNSTAANECQYIDSSGCH